MAIEDIIAKLKAVEGLDLTEDEINELQTLKPSDVDADAVNASLTAEKAAKARILEEKKKALQRAAELESQLEELKTKDMSEVEKLQADIAKATKKAEADAAEIERLQGEHASTVRSYHLERIGGEYSFLDTIPGDLRKLAVEKSFADVDLTDEDAVKSAGELFKTTYSSILAAEDAAQGAGSTPGRATQVGHNTPDKMTVEERAKYLADNNKL